MKKAYEVIGKFADDDGERVKTEFAFASESLAREYMEKYMGESMRQIFTVEPSTNVKVYNSLEEMEKENPQQGIERLKCQLENMDKNVNLPFEIAISYHNERGELIRENLKKMIFDDLKNLIFTADMFYGISENIMTQSFSFGSFAGHRGSLFDGIIIDFSRQQLDSAKKFCAEYQHEREKIMRKINLIREGKNSQEESENDDEMDIF